MMVFGISCLINNRSMSRDYHIWRYVDRFYNIGIAITMEQKLCDTWYDYNFLNDRQLQQELLGLHACQAFYNYSLFLSYYVHMCV